MKEPEFFNYMDLFSRFRNCVEEVFDGRLALRLVTEEPFSANHPNSIMLVGEAPLKTAPGLDGSATDGGEAGDFPEKRTLKTIVGKHVDVQSFFQKDEPPYSEEFMLDLEFNPDTQTCTIHNINLPIYMRDRGSGSRIIEETEKLCRHLGMKTIYVPSEHNATNFWLKQGYHFTFENEKIFYLKNENRKNIFIAYDLRKDINFPTHEVCSQG